MTVQELKILVNMLHQEADDFKQHRPNCSEEEQDDFVWAMEIIYSKLFSYSIYNPKAFRKLISNTVKLALQQERK